MSPHLDDYAHTQKGKAEGIDLHNKLKQWNVYHYLMPGEDLTFETLA
jgi:hypothetical protein